MIFKFLFSFSLLIFPVISFSQSSVIELNWTDLLEGTWNNQTYKAPTINGIPLDIAAPNYYYAQKVKSTGNATLQNATYVPASLEEINFLSQFNINIPESLKYDLKITKAAQENFISFSCCPFMNQEGIIQKLISFSVDYTPQNQNLAYEKDFVTNSVLKEGSGFWYKIAVPKDGVYKIDKAFLTSIGVDVSTLSPNHLHIYGNGDGMLPEENWINRTDDLAQNAITIVGGADGVFNDQDYVLFYGSGPHRWYANGTVEFDQKRNAYSDKSYYFININPNTLPLYIQNSVDDGLPASTVISEYNYRDVYEVDTKSLVGGGQRWYGDLFDVELEKSFSFYIPDLIPNEPIVFKTAIATNALSSAGTSQKYYCNGTLLTNVALPVISYDYVRSNKTHIYSNPSSSSLDFKISITRDSPTTLTYLDRILVNTKRNLTFLGTQFGFRNISTIDSTIKAEYQIGAFPTAGFVWDVTNNKVPVKLTGSNVSGVFSFTKNLFLSEFIASNGSAFYTPEKIGNVAYQNLHSLPQADYLIVSHPNFIQQAERLANLHRDEGMIVHVVTPDQIYNEFSSGSPDAVGIRMFMKMFYDRAVLSSDPLLYPKYLLLFGDGTYDPKDRIEGNNNFILTYQVESSENHINAMVTDDFFGMLNDNEAINPTDMVDIGIGRLVVSDNTQAKQQVDKIEHYLKNGSNLFASNTSNCCLDSTTNGTFGDWRLKFIQIADDEEGGYFINTDTEPQYDMVKLNHREMNCDKLYLDAYPQQTSAGGQRCPEVFSAITDRVERGALIVNYVGHGGEVGLAEERVVTIPQIQSWGNINALHLFVSATCEFTKYDDPERVSAGEWLSLNPIGGAIALMTTTRSVFFGVNSATGLAFYNNVFERDTNQLPRTFGTIMMITKNQSGSSDNKRSFTLIGDPALRIALPRLEIVTDSINGQYLTIIDTLNALSKVTVKGHVTDNNGALQSNYNGYLLPSVFDKVKNYITLGQDDTSPNINYELQRNIVYKGKSTIQNGRFEFSFIVPKDIALHMGTGKISYYAFNGLVDAAGLDTTFIIGGINPNGIVDNLGPTIDLFLNDDRFIDGGITDATPVLFAKLFDENGINTVGTGIGHDLIAVVDENSAAPIILNDYYSADLNTYQSGSIRYELPALAEGSHTLTLKAWDVNNNSSLAKTNFVVKPTAKGAIDHLYNYPNPFTTSTKFMFEHNQSCDQLDVQIQIYSVSGRLVKTIQEKVATKGFRTEGISWDGRDDYGDQLARGVYVYRLKLLTVEGITAEKTEKLVILK
jgi:flagellar hook assembly protein FlgD